MQLTSAPKHLIAVLLCTVSSALYAETIDPVSVESRTEARLSDLEAPFQAPVDAEDTNQLEGIEGQYQQQLLQQEVEVLRGLVEELANELKRLKETGDDRYLELDGRFQALREQMAAGGGIATPLPETPQIVSTTGGAGEQELPGQPGGQSEKTLYDTSLELIRNRQYDLAITQLQAVITGYPEGIYAANAYYWLGEVYAAKPQPDYEKARQALAQVITFFPENRKVPDAAFKLGKVYHLMGDCGRAKELLNQIISQHQGRSVAKLAESYLRNKMESCEQ